MSFNWKKLTDSATPRRPKRMEFSWDNLEDRKVLSHAGALHDLHAAVQAASTSAETASKTVHATSTTSTTGSTSTGSTGSTTSTPMCSSPGSGSGSSSSNSALAAAQKTLMTEIQTITAASSTTVGELTAIRTAFQTLKTDGLAPTSQSALQSFENTLVTDFASGTTLAGDAALLSQFEALYTTTPTTQETADLTTAYDALAAATTSSNITTADITTIDTDYAAVLSAEGNTSTTATFPLFTLVTGQGFFGGFGGHSHGGFGGPGGRF